MVYGNRFISNNDMSLLVLEQELCNPIIINELSIDDIKSKIGKLKDTIIKWVKEAWNKIKEAFGKAREFLSKKISIINKKSISIDESTSIEIEYYDKMVFKGAEFDTTILAIKKDVEGYIDKISNYDGSLDNVKPVSTYDYVHKQAEEKEEILKKNLTKVTITSKNFMEIIKDINNNIGLIEQTIGEKGKDLNDFDNLYNKFYDVVHKINDEDKNKGIKNAVTVVDRLLIIYRNYIANTIDIFREYLKVNTAAARKINDTFIHYNPTENIKDNLDSIRDVDKDDDEYYY